MPRRRRTKEPLEEGEAPSGAIHLCNVCEHAGVWGPSWKWYGSLLGMERHPNSGFLMCSDPCAAAAVAAGKVPPPEEEDANAPVPMVNPRPTAWEVECPSCGTLTDVEMGESRFGDYVREEGGPETMGPFVECRECLELLEVGAATVQPSTGDSHVRTAAEATAFRRIVDEVAAAVGQGLREVGGYGPTRISALGDAIEAAARTVAEAALAARKRHGTS